MIGKRIRLLRNKKGLLQKELAEQLNLSQQTISLYESEKREPDYVILSKIADFFNVSIDYLLGRTDIPNLYVENNDCPADKVSEDIKTLSPESQEEIKKLIELYKIRDMQSRNSELADELTSTE